ncbi:hypothetical protein R2362_03140 [Mycobacteroides chelonae]|nr:hypothetical protein [Mycobacteroides chelonae]
MTGSSEFDSEVDELIKNWLDDILHPDIDRSTVHEHICEIDGFYSLTDSEVDDCINRVIDTVYETCERIYRLLVRGELA